MTPPEKTAFCICLAADKEELERGRPGGRQPSLYYRVSTQKGERMSQIMTGMFTKEEMDGAWHKAYQDGFSAGITQSSEGQAKGGYGPYSKGFGRGGQPS